MRQEKVLHIEDLKKILESIQRTAEIILEHQRSRAFKNHLITLGTESIISMCKEAIDEIEKRKELKEGFRGDPAKQYLPPPASIQITKVTRQYGFIVIPYTKSVLSG